MRASQARRGCWQGARRRRERCRWHQPVPKLLPMICRLWRGWTTKDNAAVPRAEILSDVVFTQVCAAFGDDERPWAVTARLLAEGIAWMSRSRWRGRDVLRIPVSNWPADADDVTTPVDAVRRAAPAA